jgi:hypothetical protein
MANSEFDKEKQEIDGRINKAEREEDRTMLSLKRGGKRDKLIQSQHQQRKKWTEMLEASASNENVFLRKNLVEAAFAKKTSEAAVYIGFKSATGRNESDAGATLFGNKGSSEGKSRANVQFCFLFPSDSSREEWRIGLDSQLQEMTLDKGKKR